MKKIGIMTFHASHNNGSMLQALALQNILIHTYNCEVEIIDFSNVEQQNMYAPIPKPTNIKRFVKCIIWSLNYKEMKKQFLSYEKFSKTYFNLSDRRYEKAEDLKQIEHNFDALITGSDQVWNIKCTDADDVYYLNFVSHIPKFAYAVSFGANSPFENIDKCDIYKNYIKSFNNVSVRENNAKKWILEATGLNVAMCLDPTMLYDRDAWEKIIDIGEEPVIQGEYIFYYCFSISEEVQKFLTWVSCMTGMPVYFMEAKEWTLKSCWRHKIKLIKKYGPDVYMNVVKYANVFITTSFHGTAFGTIYRKNFWYIKAENSEKSKDDRAISFLRQLDLTSRYKTISELKQLDLSKKPDYTKTSSIIDELRNNSLNYLSMIIEELDS